MNFMAVIAAALSTFIVGFIWFNPKVMGTVWMREAGLTEEQLKKGNPLKIFGFTFIFALILAMLMQILTIHQFGALGMIGGPDFIETAKPSYAAFMEDYGTAFRTYKHGALHGFMSGLFLALPLIAINGLFELKSWKYIFIHTGYWIICMTIMGAIVCGWV